MTQPQVNINLDLKLTEPISKAIEAVKDYVGIRYEPKRIRKKAEAEAYAAEVRAEADRQVLLIRTEGEIEASEMMQRAALRLGYEEMRKQANRESIVGLALNQLPESVSDEPVDDDWIAQFFKYSEDISNEEMQALWARILAGEVTEPGTYSRRTLQLVSTLSSEEAELFETLTNYVWNGMFIPYSSPIDEYYREKGISYRYVRQLETIGLINSGLHMVTEREEHELSERDEHRLSDREAVWNEVLRLRYFDNIYILRYVSRFQVFGMTLTTVGSELSHLCNNEPDEAYLETVLENWRRSNFQIEVINLPDERELSYDA